MKLNCLTALVFALVSALAITGCSDDDGSGRVLSPAQQAGVGAECTTATQDRDCNPVQGQTCLTQFKGGYCGEQNCTQDEDCLPGSACVEHEGSNYCFLICIDKLDCNATRSFANEANCSSNIKFIEGKDSGVKVCVPPSD
jgi:hypothetical protein